MIALVALALVSVASAQRALLQDETAAAAPAVPPMGWYPGQFAGQFGQFYNPQYWQQLYGQVIPYDIYANWVNSNTAFNLPVITGLPGLPGSGST